jgi:hypothetical protein
MDLAAEAERLRTAAEAKPLKLPVNRRIDERHHAVSDDGLSVWFTIQLSPHGRIAEVVFERPVGRPADEETAAWLRELLPGQEPAEAPGPPGASVRRFEVFERRPRPRQGLNGREAPPA